MPDQALPSHTVAARVVVYCAGGKHPSILSYPPGKELDAAPLMRIVLWLKSSKGTHMLRAGQVYDEETILFPKCSLPKVERKRGHSASVV